MPHSSEQNTSPGRIIEADLNSSIEIAAARSAIFAVVSDHEGTPSWVEKVKEVKLLQEGSPRNGLGAIREVNFKPLLWTTVQEKIIRYEEGQGFDYAVQGGMPGMIEHLGRFELSGLANGMVRVDWKVHFKFSKSHWFSLFIRSFSKSFKKVQEQGLKTLKAQLEQDA